VPYLVTEYNGHMYPTKKYDVERVRVEHALRHYRVIDAAYLSNRISGTIGWCMNDYNTHDDFGSGDNICYHGVLDMYRLPKYASYIYSSQQSKKPVLEVLTTLNAGEYPMSFMDDIYIASNLDYIKLYQENLYIDTFYPDKESKLPHPLIVVNDLIGNQLIEKEGFSKRDSDLVKKIFKLIPRYGHALPLRYKLRMFVLMKKYHLKIVDGINLYYKYCNPASNYRFVGYRENEPVKTVVREPVKFTTYHIEADSTVLEIGATYDVTRIIVSKYDQNRNLLPYAFDAFFVRVEGGAQLIGPELLSLSAGQMAFWVKTNGKDDTALVKVNFTGKELNIRLKINRRK
ncbi:MAG: glycoside hydrolase family 2 protein, partial [Bacilli bacterium]|nr:glycoside hydrolase family 2 protein [Bacilli bacterium]